MKFYKCAHCGNIIAYIHDSGVRASCCGEVMQVLHPMLDAHYIEWIILETKQGRQRKALKPGDEPKAVFALVPGDEVVAAYEYCNLHGLWKAE